MPSEARARTADAPNMSRPMRPMNATRPPARAAATAWFAPFPPGAMAKAPPRTVSPGRGMRSALTIMSVLELPTTTIATSDMRRPPDEIAFLMVTARKVRLIL